MNTAIHGREKANGALVDECCVKHTASCIIRWYGMQVITRRTSAWLVTKVSDIVTPARCRPCYASWHAKKAPCQLAHLTGCRYTAEQGGDVALHGL